MLTRRFAAVLLIPLALGACADNVSTAGTPASSVPAVSSSVPPSPSAKPSSGGGETITGKVTAGVEPNCLLLQDATGSHLLVFHDPALRSAAPAGAEVTLIGRSEPKMMSTCQQG